METRQIFHQGDELLLFSKEPNNTLNRRVRVIGASPLTLEIIDPIDETLINKLNSAGEVVVAYARGGYAYKARIAGRNANVVQVSLTDRYEMRESFRVETSIFMSYEFIGRAPGMGPKKTGEAGELDLKGVEGATAADIAILRMLGKIHQELRLLRGAAEKSNKTPNTQMVERWVSISGTGIRFTADEEMARGDTLRLNFSIPKLSRMITCAAAVMRVEADLSGGGATRSQTALRFKDISDTDKEQIVRFVIQQQQQFLHRPFVRNQK